MIYYVYLFPIVIYEIFYGTALEVFLFWVGAVMDCVHMHIFFFLNQRHVIDKNKDCLMIKQISV